MRISGRRCEALNTYPALIVFISFSLSASCTQHFISLVKRGAVTFWPQNWVLNHWVRRRGRKFTVVIPKDAPTEAADSSAPSEVRGGGYTMTWTHVRKDEGLPQTVVQSLQCHEAARRRALATTSGGGHATTSGGGHALAWSCRGWVTKVGARARACVARACACLAPVQRALTHVKVGYDSYFTRGSLHVTSLNGHLTSNLGDVTSKFRRQAENFGKREC